MKKETTLKCGFCNKELEKENIISVKWGVHTLLKCTYCNAILGVAY